MGATLTLHEAILAAAPALGVLALAFGPLAAWLAARRQRNPALWLLFGAILGPIALVLIQVAPPRRCWNCSEPTAGFESRCSTCGADLRTPHATSPAELAAAVPDEWTEPRVLRSVPDPRHDVTLAARIAAQDLEGAAGVAGGRPDRLSAVGARRPASSSGIAADPPEGRPDVTMLAIGVLVRSSEPMLPGSRYLIARTHDRLHIIGPIEASDQHVELDMPLAGIEANFIADRLVITGKADDSRHSILLAFQSVAGMAGRPVDQAIMETTGPISIAAYRP
jgi:hypothetical protein